MPRSEPRRPSRARRAPTPAAEVAAGAEGSSLVEAVYHRLLHGILTGAYPDGSVLSELGVARDLGVSRTPVHDALRLLGKDGLVVRERNCRARVAAITPDDVFEVFEMRKILEGPAAELAAGRMDRRHLAPLRAAADALKGTPRAADWVARWAAFDEAFHRGIADASGNRRLAADINRYRLLHTGFNRVATDAAALQPALAEHVAILDALEARNGPLARDRMVAHIAAWQDHFIRHVPRPAGT
jgi:DNA-binding GntR family transcriptional regulator